MPDASLLEMKISFYIFGGNFSFITTLFFIFAILELYFKYGIILYKNYTVHLLFLKKKNPFPKKNFCVIICNLGLFLEKKVKKKNTRKH